MVADRGEECSGSERGLERSHVTGWEYTWVVPMWNVKQAGRPGVDRRLVGDGVIDRAAPVLD